MIPELVDPHFEAVGGTEWYDPRTLPNGTWQALVRYRIESYVWGL